MNRKILSLLLVLVLTLISPPWLAAQEVTGDDQEETTEVDVSIGGWRADPSGSPDLVSEYEPNDDSPRLGLELETLQPWGHLYLEGLWRHPDDQDAVLDLDVRRMIRSHTEVVRLPHRLTHDPLTNLATATNHGRIVQHTDLDPEGVYGIVYGMVSHRTELQPRGFSNLTLALDVRSQERDGTRQLTTISHCDSCHVIGRSTSAPRTSVSRRATPGSVRRSSPPSVTASSARTRRRSACSSTTPCSRS